MERGLETGYKDKFGRSMHVDDIVQYRLGKFGKSDGPRSSRIIEFHGKFQLVGESETNLIYGGSRLSEDICKFLVVLHCTHMPT